MSMLRLLLEHAETCSTAEVTRGHHACVHAVVCGMKLADPGIATEPSGLTGSQSRLTDILTTAAVPGRSAALDVCVASSTAAAARGDAAQAAFDRKISHYRNEIGGTAATGRSLSLSCLDSGWTTAPGRHANASVRSRHCLQPERAANAGGITSSQVEARNLNRRAAMARAVLPNPSARAEWFLAGVIDRALHRWRHVPPLDGGPGDHDFADSETDTAIQTTTSPLSQVMRLSLCSHQVSNCLVCSPCGPAMALPCDGRDQLLRSSVLFGDLRLENMFADNGVSGQLVDEMLALERDTFQRCLSRSTV